MLTRGYIGIMEKQMEATIWGWVLVGRESTHLPVQQNLKHPKQ